MFLKLLILFCCVIFAAGQTCKGKVPKLTHEQVNKKPEQGEECQSCLQIDWENYSEILRHSTCSEEKLNLCKSLWDLLTGTCKVECEGGGGVWQSKYNECSPWEKPETENAEKASNTGANTLSRPSSLMVSITLAACTLFVL